MKPFRHEYAGVDHQGVVQKNTLVYEMTRTPEGENFFAVFVDGKLTASFYLDDDGNPTRTPAGYMKTN